MAIVKEETKMEYSTKKVASLKYWRFPNGIVYILRCENADKSTTYFTFLNTPYKMTFIDSTYVPFYMVSEMIEYVYLNEMLKNFLGGLYKHQVFKNQESIKKVKFF